RSERFHGTMYSTFGNSRLPVISVVSSSSRSGPLRAPALAVAAPWRVPLAFAAPSADGGTAGAAAGADAAEGAGAAVRGDAGSAVDVCPEVGAAGALEVGAAGAVGVVLTPGSSWSGRGISRLPGEVAEGAVVSCAVARHGRASTMTPIAQTALPI